MSLFFDYRTIVLQSKEQPMIVISSYQAAPTATVDVDGTTFVYRDLGPRAGTPVIFLNHLAAVLDNWDPRVVDGIAAQRRVITFDNRGVGASAGGGPRPHARRGQKGARVIRARGFGPGDPLWFFFGGVAG